MTREDTVPAAAPEIPVSWGELIDKITILEIKNERLTDETALGNVQGELAMLSARLRALAVDVETFAALKLRLSSVNEALWDIENRIREKEAAGQFDADFIALARSVYQRNDERAAIKREINVTFFSSLVEEKSYSNYR